MRDKSSFTAATMALQRALESQRPPATRLFDDPYAEAFTHGTLRVLVRASRVPIFGRLAPWLYDAIAGPGPRPSAVARTRLIDDLINATAPQVGQVVILGAGFDTRAHRLRSLAELPIFEVDHLGLTNSNVIYVPVDFEQDSLNYELEAAGFDRGARTLVVWEGVTNYLSAEAVAETLLTIRRLAAAGGTLIFTYIHAGVLDGSASFPEAARWIRNVQRAGEPWTFGLIPDRLRAFLGGLGYTLESDVSTRDADDRWFPALGRRERGSALYHVAVARIG